MNGDELSDLYRIRFEADLLPRKREIWRVICADFLQRYVRPTDTVVDIACGYGEFLNNIRAARKIAVDLNPDAKTFLEPSTEFHLCEATRLGEIVDGQADVVFTSNFLEHLPDKKTLDVFLDQVMKALRILGFLRSPTRVDSLVPRGGAADARLPGRPNDRPVSAPHHAGRTADASNAGQGLSEGTVRMAGAGQAVFHRRPQALRADSPWRR
jgi:SAM-dependent methyltransferase